MQELEQGKTFPILLSLNFIRFYTYQNNHQYGIRKKGQYSCPKTKKRDNTLALKPKKKGQYSCPKTKQKIKNDAIHVMKNILVFLRINSFFLHNLSMCKIRAFTNKQYM